MEGRLAIHKNRVPGSQLALGHPADLNGVVAVGWFDVFEEFAVSFDNVVFLDLFATGGDGDLVVAAVDDVPGYEDGAAAKSLEVDFGLAVGRDDGIDKSVVHEFLNDILVVLGDALRGSENVGHVVGECDLAHTERGVGSDDGTTGLFGAFPLDGAADLAVFTGNTALDALDGSTVCRVFCPEKQE